MRTLRGHSRACCYCSDVRGDDKAAKTDGGGKGKELRRGRWAKNDSV